MDNSATYVEPLQPDQQDYNLLEHFKRHHIPPPGALYVTVDDIIQVDSYGTIATQAFQLALRLLTPSGQIVPAFFNLIALAQGVTPTVNLLRNLEGFILSASVSQTGGLRGALYVRVLIQRGVGSGDLTKGQVLLAGYPSAVDALGYPQSVPQSSLDGRGLANVLAVADPAAGADYSIIVPAGVNWIVRSIRLHLVTAVAVATRDPTLVIDDGAGHVFAIIGAAATIPASQTVDLTFATGLAPSNVNNVQQNGLPAEMRLAGGWRIRTVTANIQAADQYSGCALELETFIGA